MGDHDDKNLINKNIQVDDVIIIGYQFAIVKKVSWEIEEPESDDESNDINYYDNDNDDNDNSNDDNSKGHDEETGLYLNSYSDSEEEEDEEEKEDKEYESEEEEEEEESDEEKLERMIRRYKFTNSETGILVLFIFTYEVLETDVKNVQLFDKTLTIADCVQKNDSSKGDLLGLITKTEKEYWVVPYSLYNVKGHIDRESDLVKVKDTRCVSNNTYFIYDNRVAGRVTQEMFDITVSDPRGKLHTFIWNSSINFDNYYIDDLELCPGKTLRYQKEKCTIVDVKSRGILVDWKFYFDEDTDFMPPTRVSPSNPKLEHIKENFNTHCLGDSLLFKRPPTKKSEGTNEQQYEGGFVYVMKSKSLVSWQDGSESLENNTDLIQVDCISTDYFPNQIVCNSKSPPNSNWGSIASYDPLNRTCSVYWSNFNNPLGKSIVLNPDIQEESYLQSHIPVYELLYIETLNFDESDFVTRITPINDINEIGQIMRKDKLKLIVKWGNGKIESNWPFELCLVDLDGNEDYDEEEEEDSNDLDIENKKEMINMLDKTKEALSQQLDILGVLSPSCFDSITNNNINNNNNNNTINNNNNSNNKNKISNITNNTSNNFEILGQVEIHNYLIQSEQVLANKRYFSAIKKEIELLKTSLPPGIFVKGFSDRINLYQALIIGPMETIYENSIFIFDIFLPQHYPSVPPQVHFHSVCYKLHPNLYQDGNVCLSLLGTWHGNKNENWQPDISSLNQVLISIQALILGSPEPYYLEAGYESQIGTKIGKRNSSLYNADSYLLSLESLYFYLGTQPTVFSKIIREHLLSKKDEILGRIDQFLDYKPLSTSSESKTEILGITLPTSQVFLNQLSKLKSKIQESYSKL